MSPKDDRWDSSLDHFINFWWSEVMKKVKDAIVFIDNPAAECLHWNLGGAQALFNAGALGVKELSPLETGTKEQQKAVFLTSEDVGGVTEMAIRDIILGSRFEHCIVITAAPATIHASIKATDSQPVDDPNNLRAFVELENRLLRWMGNAYCPQQSYTSEVLYCPLFAAQLQENVFIMPPFSDFMGELGPQALEKKFSINPKHMDHLAACLHSLMAFFSAREDVFSVGELSSALAAKLDALPAARTRRKTAQNRLSIILFDRGLDLATGCNSDTSNCLLDRILSVLPPFPGHSAERCVDMSSLCIATRKAPSGLPLPLVPGCALQPAGISTFIEASSVKEGLLSVQRSILEASKGTPTIRVTAESLAKRAKALALHGGLQQHANLLQQCLAVIQCTGGPDSTSLELLAGMQKVLVQNLAVEDGEKGFSDVVKQITALLKTRKERDLKLDAVILLLIHIFSLAGSEHNLIVSAAEEIKAAEAALSEALLEDCQASENNWPGVINDEVQSSRVSSEIFKKLKFVAEARRKMTKYRNLITRQSSQQPATVTPLLPTIVDDCLNKNNSPELSSDIICSIQGSSRGALGLFLGSAKTHPSDNPLIVVLVLGGITGSEIRAIQNSASLNGKHVIIGSTRLITPRDCLHYVYPTALVTPIL
ncbi:sec1 family domain-containing protein 2-like [Neocloeon triangulifer]|uniref:sec1 family domain-containing protein 2-like n=1 Tax=Neocloeon triangulifer TaxID=2078957 RepID=UPI00286ECE9E|nr:sec1 family domain-containing protein 2-like [Neocloeon triangulifer]XP_059471743.1 sec1 family domain-containing protein 2-like [Neocloeon triangulifer]